MAMQKEKITKEDFNVFFDTLSRWFNDTGKAITPEGICTIFENIFENHTTEGVLTTISDVIFSTMQAKFPAPNFDQLKKVNALRIELQKKDKSINTRLYSTYLNYLADHLISYLRFHLEVITNEYMLLYKKSLSGDKTSIQERIIFEQTQLKSLSGVGYFLVDHNGAAPPKVDAGSFLNNEKQKEVKEKFLIPFWRRDFMELLKNCLNSAERNFDEMTDRLLSHVQAIQYLGMESREIYDSIMDSLGQILTSLNFQYKGKDGIIKIKSKLEEKIITLQTQQTSSWVSFTSWVPLLAGNASTNINLLQIFLSCVKKILEAGYKPGQQYDSTVRDFINKIQGYVEQIKTNDIDFLYLYYNEEHCITNAVFIISQLVTSYKSISSHSNQPIFQRLMDQAFPVLDEDTFEAINKIARIETFMKHDPVLRKAFCNYLYEKRKMALEAIVREYLDPNKTFTFHEADNYCVRIITAAMLFINLFVPISTYKYKDKFIQIGRIFASICPTDKITTDQESRILKLFMKMDDRKIPIFERYNKQQVDYCMRGFDGQIKDLYIKYIAIHWDKTFADIVDTYKQKCRRFIFGEITLQELQQFNSFLKSSAVYIEAEYKPDCNWDLFFIKQAISDITNREEILAFRETIADKYNALVQKYIDLYYAYLFGGSEDLSAFEVFREEIQYAPEFLLRGIEMRFDNLQELTEFEQAIQTECAVSKVTEEYLNDEVIIGYKESYKKLLSLYIEGKIKVKDLLPTEDYLKTYKGGLALLKPDESLTVLNSFKAVPFLKDERLNELRIDTMKLIVAESQDIQSISQRCIAVPQLPPEEYSRLCTIGQIYPELHDDLVFVKDMRHFIQLQIEKLFADYPGNKDIFIQNLLEHPETVIYEIPMRVKIMVILGTSFDHRQIVLPKDQRSEFIQSINMHFLKWCSNICIFANGIDELENSQHEPISEAGANDGGSGVPLTTIQTPSGKP